MTRPLSFPTGSRGVFAFTLNAWSDEARAAAAEARKAHAGKDVTVGDMLRSGLKSKRGEFDRGPLSFMRDKAPHEALAEAADIHQKHSKHLEKLRKIAAAQAEPEAGSPDERNWRAAESRSGTAMPSNVWASRHAVPAQEQYLKAVESSGDAIKSLSRAHAKTHAKSKEIKTNGFSTGSRGVSATVLNAADKLETAKPDPVTKARQAAADAADEQTRVEQEAEQAAARQDAVTASKEADTRTGKAAKMKLGSPASKKAHQAAAMAHADAKTHWAKQAGPAAGNDLDARAQAKRKADAHGEQAKRHGVLGGSGLKSVSTYNTGSKRIVANTWSDAARESAAAARRASTASTASEHESAAKWHRDQVDTAPSESSARAHTRAAIAHDEASYHAARKTPTAAVRSRTARQVSEHAIGVSERADAFRRSSPGTAAMR